jgi:lipopolysaccharide transport system ATP-binding protein
VTDVAIRIQGLAKQYRIGERQRYKSLRESIMKTLAAPFRPGGRRQRETIWALDDLSLEIQRGDAVGIIGRNGAGKSTLLKILSRITEPTRGRVEVHGRVGSLLEVGTGFHLELTGRENIYLNGAILGMKRAEIGRKFDEIVAFSEVEKFLDTPVKHFSTGMYLRLAFAVAAHLEPEILLVDEVLAVGDASFQKKCMGKMGEVARAGRTVLFVSHNMAAVQHLCPRSILLENGRVSRDSETSEVIQGYIRSLDETPVADLSRFTNRQGAGHVRFTAIRFFDDNGAEISRGVSGQPVVFAMDYLSQGGGPLGNVRASLAFYDKFGQVLFNCSSELTGAGPAKLPPKGTISCRIPRLPLSQSRYRIAPFLEVGGEIQDWITPGLPFDVIDGDFFGSGRVYPSGWQGVGVLVPHSWDLPSKDGSS